MVLRELGWGRWWCEWSPLPHQAPCHQLYLEPVPQWAQQKVQETQRHAGVQSQSFQFSPV